MEPGGQGPHRRPPWRDWKVGEASEASWRGVGAGGCPGREVSSSGREEALLESPGEELTERRGRPRVRAAAPSRAGHPPLSAEAAAEEEESRPRDLQRPPARGLEHLPAEGSPIRAASFPLPGTGGPAPGRSRMGSGGTLLPAHLPLLPGPAPPAPPGPQGTHTNQCSPRTISSCPPSRVRASRRAW